MLSIYDLYDLSAIFKNVRAFPEYQLNEKVLENILIIFHAKDGYKLNQFRLSISSIPQIDKDIYGFAFVENRYTYFPSFLKEESICLLLQETCKSLLQVVKEQNTQKVIDLADCLHNLPIDISENNFCIPKHFWKASVKSYREKWDKNFLKTLQKEL